VEWHPKKAGPREVTMKRSAAIASGAALLLACAFAAQAQDKISDGVVKIGMLEWSAYLVFGSKMPWLAFSGL
jgi:hypothetical protein